MNKRFRIGIIVTIVIVTVAMVGGCLEDKEVQFTFRSTNAETTPTLTSTPTPTSVPSSIPTAPPSAKVVGVYENRVSSTAITFTVTKIEPEGLIQSIEMTAPVIDDSWTGGLTVGSTHTYVNSALTGPVYVVLKGTFYDGTSEIIFANTI